MTLPIEDAQPAVKMVWHHASSEHPTLSDFVIYSGFVCLYAGSRYCVFTTASSLLIIFQRAKLSTRNITHFCWCNWRTFWRKNAAGMSPRGSRSCTTMPRLTGQLQPRRNWPTWASNVLITHPILPICPRWSITCSLGWKNNWKVAIFHLMRRSLLPGRPGWIDNLMNFFWVACRSYSNRLRSVLSFVRSMLNKPWVWSL